MSARKQKKHTDTTTTILQYLLFNKITSNLCSLNFVNTVETSFGQVISSHHLVHCVHLALSLVAK